MQAFIVNPVTGARTPTPFTMVMSALDTWGKIDLCKETSTHAVIAHNCAFMQMVGTAKALGYAVREWG